MSFATLFAASSAFESARQLAVLHADHPARRLHGHGFEVILHANQDAGGRDLSIDYGDLDAIWTPLHETRGCGAVALMDRDGPALPV